VVTVLGFDIGGANTKAAFIRTQSGVISELLTVSEYFPFWKRDLTQFSRMLNKIKLTLMGSANPDAVAVTMTAELSDRFPSKRDGVNQILDCVSHAFGAARVWVLDVDANLRSIEAARNEPLKVASANWAATGWMIAQKITDCVIVDIGSTSTSIIPIMNGKIAAKGKTDLEKLINGELIYTGSLRTNVAAIVQTIPLRNGLARVSSELFAQSGDVHLVLKHIDEADYSSDTADGRGKSLPEALTRLARDVCADAEMLSEQEILEIAQYAYVKQVEQIADGINQVYANLVPNAKETIPVVVTGLGKDFLSRKGAEKAGIKRILDLGELYPGSTVASPAVGTAFMAAVKLEGASLKWTQ